MKKRYQIEKARASARFEKWAKENEVPIQLTFATSDMAQLTQTSLGDRLRAVGKMFIENVMESEVRGLAGNRSQPNQERQAYRWGKEAGFCIVDGQKVPIDRPWVRSSQHKREIPLGSYEMFQRASLVEETVWQR